MNTNADDKIKVSEESTCQCVSKYRHNALIPISRLPLEILTKIFLLLPPSAWDDKEPETFYVPQGREQKRFFTIPKRYLEWLRFTHVCHRWREIALSYPLLWNYVNFSKLAMGSRMSQSNIVEMLARAKTAPLHLKANLNMLSFPFIDTFKGQLEAHISHIRHLSIAGELESVLGQLVSSAPVLKSLSLLNISASSTPSQPITITPVAFPNIAAPKLTSLLLESCNISWAALPLLRCLQILRIREPSREARPTLEDWLDALNEMPQLTTLCLHSASPIASVGNPLVSKPQHTVSLPCLTRFDISASAEDCALALTHLMLPVLTLLHVEAESHEWDGEDVRRLIPYVAQKVHGPQDMMPLRSFVFSWEELRAEMLAWTVPDLDNMLSDYPITQHSAALSARVYFSATSNDWNDEMDTVIFDALLMHIPVNALSTLSIINHARLSKEVWIHTAPRLAMLERVCLVPASVEAFYMMLAEDAPPDGPPRLPQLTRLTLLDATSAVFPLFLLHDTLMERIKQGAPIEVLNLPGCRADDYTIEWFENVVGELLCPPYRRDHEQCIVFRLAGSS